MHNMRIKGIIGGLTFAQRSTQTLNGGIVAPKQVIRVHHGIRQPAVSDATHQFGWNSVPALHNQSWRHARGVR